jgi:hypothetical protein
LRLYQPVRWKAVIVPTHLKIPGQKYGACVHPSQFKKKCRFYLTKPAAEGESGLIRNRIPSKKDIRPLLHLQRFGGLKTFAHFFCFRVFVQAPMHLVPFSQYAGDGDTGYGQNRLFIVDADKYFSDEPGYFHDTYHHSS